MKRTYICPIARMNKLSLTHVIAASDINAMAEGSTDNVGAKENNSMWHWVDKDEE